MKKVNFLNLLILVLSIYVLGSLVIDTFFKLPPEISSLLHVIDFAICGVFFIDFCVQFYNAENKLAFMKWGWVDLLASIPMVDFFRVGRLIRMIRILRIFKAFKTMKAFIDEIYLDKAKGTFNSMMILALLMMIFCFITILIVEREPTSNILTAGDSLWWVFVTITTVGYGDFYPVTLEGRLIAVLLMTTGVGLFGTFTAFIANWFLEK